MLPCRQKQGPWLSQIQVPFTIPACYLDATDVVVQHLSINQARTTFKAKFTTWISELAALLKENEVGCLGGNV